jgi:hypothetical protein
MKKEKFSPKRGKTNTNVTPANAGVQKLLLLNQSLKKSPGFRLSPE